MVAHIPDKSAIGKSMPSDLIRGWSSVGSLEREPPSSAGTAGCLAAALGRAQPTVTATPAPALRKRHRSAARLARPRPYVRGRGTISTPQGDSGDKAPYTPKECTRDSRSEAR